MIEIREVTRFEVYDTKIDVVLDEVRTLEKAITVANQAAQKREENG